MQFLRQTDGITMNRERLLFDAKQRVLELAKGYHPPGLWKHNYSGATGRAALELVMEGYKLSKHLTEHDLQVCRALANVLCGGETDIAGPVTEEKFAFVEQREFMELIQLPETLSCIERMLDISRFLGRSHQFFVKRRVRLRELPSLVPSVRQAERRCRA